MGTHAATAQLGPEPHDCLAAVRQALADPSLEEGHLSVYEHLLGRASATVDAIAGAAGLSLDTTRAVLERLLLLGLVQQDDDTYLAISPRVALGRLLDQRESFLAGQRQSLLAARSAAEAFISDYEQHRVTHSEQIEMLRSRQAVLARVGELTQAARTHSWVMLTTLQSPESLAGARRTELDLLSRGVEVRTLLLDGHLRRSRELTEYEVEMERAGAHIRVASTLPTRLSIWDRSVALLPIDPDQPRLGGCLVATPGLIHLLVATFERYWSTATCLSDHLAKAGRLAVDETEGWTPSPLELEILRLLADGHKDEALARRVGMSPRSVRRILTKLNEELGASSRFQLGVNAAQRGYI